MEYLIFAFFLLAFILYIFIKPSWAEEIFNDIDLEEEFYKEITSDYSKEKFYSNTNKIESYKNNKNKE